MRNPEWTRDELILGIDVYFRLKTSELNPNHREIVALSELLNELPLHPQHLRDARFRNPPGVSMELRALLRFDPRYKGKGLRGARLGEETWREFSNDLENLRATANAIRNSYKELRELTKHTAHIADPDGDEADQFLEGSILTRLHRIRERNGSLVEAKRRTVLRETGRLACEACDFDFLEVYGELGDGCAECHHILPLSQLPGRRLTRLADLSIVCANCHRILHRSKKWLAISELRQLIHGRPTAVAN